MDLKRIFTAGSFRRKLLIVLLAIFLPALGIILASGLSQRQHEIADAQKDALLLVGSLAAQQEQIVLTTKTLLRTLAQLPEVQRLDAPACNRIFRELQQEYPFYSVIVAATPDGHVFAASTPFAPSLNLADRKHFQDTLKTRDFSVGEYATGRISKAAVISYGFPVLDINKKMTAILIAGFNLNEFGRFISTAKLPEGSAVALTDHRGVRLYRWPQHEATPQGQPPPQSYLDLLSGENTPGLFEWQARDGINRLWAYRQLRLRENQPPYLYMSVGLPKDRILQAANLKMLGNLSILGIAALLALSLAWFLGNRVFIQPIDRLIAAVQQFGRGQLEARTDLPHAPDELGRLAQAFDEMAALLERKDQERQQAEEALRQANDNLERRVQERTKELTAANASILKSVEQQNFLASIVESSEDAIIGKDLQGNILSWNAGAEQLYGYTAGEVLGQYINLLIPSKYTEDFRQILARVSQGLQVKHYETIRLRKDGGQVQVSLTVSPIKNAAGEVIGASSTARDITEHKRMEEALRATSLYARSLIEASLDPLVTISPAGKITDVNRATEEATGLDRENLIGRDFSEYFTEPAQAREGYQQVLAQGWVRDYPLALRHTSGQVLEVLYNATTYTNDAGEVQGVFAAARDVTARKKMEEELRATSLYVRSLIEASLDPLVTISPAGKITDVNRATEEATGLDREHLTGNDFSEYFTEPAKAGEGYQQVLAQGWVRDYPLALRHTSGQVMEVLYNATTYTNDAGEVQGVFAAARDVTARNEAERQVQRLNKELEQRVRERTAQLESAIKEMEAFSYSVSHDLRAPLRSMSGFSHLILEKYQEALDDQGKDYLRRIVSANEHMGQLIDDILKLSRLSRTEMLHEKVDLSSEVRKILEELQKQKPDRQVELFIGEGLETYGDPTLLRVTLENLLNNAWKFTGKQHQARIEFGLTEKDGRRAFFVRDNGAGFDMAYVDRLFGAFQRLHQTTEYPGTGIGLAIVKRAIHRHGGEVWAEGAVGQGAVFYFTLS